MTFGNFELFVNGQAIHFSRKKSKELLAYLIDLRGGAATKRDIAAVLFEERPYDERVQDNIKKMARDLCSDLRKAGADGIFIHRWNHYAVDRDQFTCDLYEYEAGEQRAKTAFREEYMNQYSWVEPRRGYLLSLYEQ